MAENGQIAAEIAKLHREVRRLTGRERRRARARADRRKRRPRDLVKVLEVAAVRHAIAAARRDGPLAWAIVATGYPFGLRAGEYGRVRRQHVRLDGTDGGELYVTAEKDSISQTQAINPSLLDLAPVLRAWLAASPDGPWLGCHAARPTRTS